MDNYCDCKVEELDTQNPIHLLKYPEKFKLNFYSSGKKSILLLESQEYEECVLYLNKTLDLFDLGKDILKNISPYWKLCIYGNFACAYQRLWELDRCAKYCEKVEMQLTNLFKQENRKEYRLNFVKSLIRIKFERCALLSQLNKHEQAIEICKGIFSLLQTFLTFISSYIEGKLKNEKTKKKRDNISFMEEVYEFSKKINKNLMITMKEPVNKISKEPFYYWEKNPQKNEEQVLKKYMGLKENEKWKKSILGVTKSRSWINDFNISSVMKIPQYYLDDFEKPSPIEEYVFKEKIYETVIYCSLAHFILATQMRFLETGKEKFEVEENYDGKIQTIKKKYGYQDKSEDFLLSEAHHLKAINIISQNVQFNIPYLTHIIRSYEKHYINNKPLEKIFSIAEESAMSGTLKDRVHEQVYDIHIKDSGMKKKRTGFEKNSKEIGTVHKKNFYSKFERKSDFLQRLQHKKNSKLSNKSFSKSKKEKCTSADRRKSSENVSGRKSKRKSPQKQISLFETYGSGEKGKSESKISIGERKGKVIRKLVQCGR